MAFCSIYTPTATLLVTVLELLTLQKLENATWYGGCEEDRIQSIVLRTFTMR